MESDTPNVDYNRGHFEGKVLAMLESIKTTIEKELVRADETHRELKKDIGEVEVRVSKLEQFRLKLIGAFAVITFVASVAANFMMDFLRKIL